MPSFWLGLVLMIVFGLHLGLLPISGTGSWQHYVMPGIVLAFTGIPALTRLNLQRNDRGAGIRLCAHSASQWTYTLQHTVQACITECRHSGSCNRVGAVRIYARSGSIVIESVFAMHGVGYLAWEAIGKNDFPVVQAVVLVLAVIYVGLTLLADVVNAMLDPRLRTS